MARSSGNVRMGPVGIFTMIILLCLSVMAVLTAVTAHASYASAEKQASYATATYDNESQGWEAVAIVDDALARTQISRHDAEFGALFAAASVNTKFVEGMSAVAENSKVHITISAENGRQLDITIDVTPQLQAIITSWTVTTEPESHANDDVLWISKQ